MAFTLGVILAGGRGERLAASVPKALAMVGGMTLLARAQRALAGCCDRVLVVAPDGVAQALPVTNVVCDAGEGPLGGVAAAFQHAAFDRALVLGVDFPLMSSVALRGMLDALEGADAVAIADGGVLQPLAAAYAAGARAPLIAAHQSGERSLRRALDALRVTVLDSAARAALDPEGVCWLNLNTPEDRARAEALLRARNAA